MRRKVLLVTVIVLLVLSNAGTYMIATGRVPWLHARGELPSGTPETQAFFEVLARIQQQFVDEGRASDIADLVRGATAGMVDSLGDPYSVYLDRDEYERFQTSNISGKYSGVGIEITGQDGYVIVIAPIKDTPAYREGILPMDKIVAVDGQSIIGWPVQEASEVIRGEAGTAVVLTIRRDGVPQPFDVRIVRELIELKTVQHKILEPGIGYLQISAFREDTAYDARASLEALRREGMKVLILDLRDDPGGLLDRCVEVAGFLVPEGVVVTTTYRDGREEVHRVSGAGLGLPLITLVNGATASAAEIVAGAIQDRGAGVLVGTRTFGKALVQEVFRLPDGGGLKLTTARYLTPSGRDINRDQQGGGGIVPDVVVENLATAPGDPRIVLDDPEDARNIQLHRALELARGHLTASP